MPVPPKKESRHMSHPSIMSMGKKPDTTPVKAGPPSVPTSWKPGDTQASRNAVSSPVIGKAPSSVPVMKLKTSVVEKPSGPFSASSLSGISGIDSDGIRSGYVASVIDGFPDLDAMVIETVKRRVSEFSYGSIRNLVVYGEDASRMYSDIVSRLLELSQLGHIDLDRRIDAIGQITREINADDFSKGVFIKAMAQIITGTSIQEKLEKAISDMDCAIAYIRDMMPDMLERISEMETLNRKMQEMRKELIVNETVLAIAIKYNNEERKDSPDILDDVLDKRLESIKTRLIDSAGLPDQIGIMQKSIASRISLANDTVINLADSWKMQCSLALTMMNERGHVSGEVTGYISAARDRILNAIST